MNNHNVMNNHQFNTTSYLSKVSRYGKNRGKKGAQLDFAAAALTNLLLSIATNLPLFSNNF